MKVIRLLLLLGLRILFQLQVQADQNDFNGSNESSILMTDIISQRSNFHEGDEKLIEFNVSLTNVEISVGTVYDNPLRSFDLVIRYKDSTIVKIIHSILTAFWQKMKSTDHMDLLSLTVLYHRLTQAVINQKQTSDEMRTEAIITRNEVRSGIITAAAKRLKEAVVNRNYPNNTNIQVMTKMLQQINNSIIDDTYRKLINDVYNEVATENLIRDMCSNKNASQVVTAVMAIFEKVLQNRNASGRNEMLIADCLKRLLDASAFATLSEEKKNNFSFVISNLPNSIRNLYFAEKICIRNAHYLEYLYTPYHNSDNLVDKEGMMRYVFASNDKDFNKEKAYWIAEQERNTEFVFTFTSDFQRNEFLFVPGYVKHLFGYLEVATWIYGGPILNNDAFWSIETVGDNVAILNKIFNTYLCIKGRKHKLTNERLVFATSKANYNSPKCQWTIENCLYRTASIAYLL